MLAPIRYVQITRIGPAVACFFVGKHGFEWSLSPNIRQNSDHVAMMNLNLTTQAAQMFIQISQGLADEFKVLKSGIRLKPQFWLNDVDTANRA